MLGTLPLGEVEPFGELTVIVVDGMSDGSKAAGGLVRSRLESDVGKVVVGLSGAGLAECRDSRLGDTEPRLSRRSP